MSNKLIPLKFMLKNFKRAAKKCNGGLLMKRIILAMFVICSLFYALDATAEKRITIKKTN